MVCFMIALIIFVKIMAMVMVTPVDLAVCVVSVLTVAFAGSTFMVM